RPASYAHKIYGNIEGTIKLADNPATVGRNGIDTTNISARKVVIMGKVTGNIQCVDRLDIRSEGSLTGDIVTQRISIEDGAFLKGSVQVRAIEHKHDKAQQQQSKALSTESGKPSIEQPKAASAVAGR